MPALVQFIGTPAAAQVAVSAAVAQPGNAAEAATLSRLATAINTEIANMGAANQVSVYLSLTHTEKTCSCEFQIDKATPVVGTQLVQLSNQSPAN
jgi:hypothetical protein